MKESIGFFDSGVGGLTVLRYAQALMPEENFIYFGDSKNAPYGIRPKEEILRLVRAGCGFLLDRGVKALVIACNTATSVAVDDLRARLTIPVISMEPAIKPALEQTDGVVLLMATDATISSARVQALIERYDPTGRVIGVPCRLLAKKIEDAVFDGAKVDSYLCELLAPYKNEPVTALVLGCTHYPLVRDRILAALGKDAKVYDGIEGTVRHLFDEIVRLGLKNNDQSPGKTEIYSSRDQEKANQFYRNLISGGIL